MKYNKKSLLLLAFLGLCVLLLSRCNGHEIKNCMSCHENVQHSFAKDAVAAQQLVNNCIDCHMPNQPSKAITFQLSSKEEKQAYLLRTHKIAVY